MIVLGISEDLVTVRDKRNPKSIKLSTRPVLGKMHAALGAIDAELSQLVGLCLMQSS